jgi:hypothetical protein
MGTLFSRGQFAQPAELAACCVRARMQLETAPVADREMAHNRVSARIAFLEFTGYVTRVQLLLEGTGAEVLYKMRSHDWGSKLLQEGQVVTLPWSRDDYVFLGY